MTEIHYLNRITMKSPIKDEMMYAMRSYMTFGSHYRSYGGVYRLTGDIPKVECQECDLGLLFLTCST